ncbi:MAG: PEGA domain-containing protein [Myxococcales bacterium]|nr:PEGA domain-containing protein [Myxococcales bacterium]
MITFDGLVKLVDFGLAKALADGDAHTRSGTLRGKFGYMAPEQIAGIPVDHRIDVFAAGVVLWEALTAQRLFKGQTDLQSIALVREAKVAPPSTANKAVPPRLDAITLRALARDREERYQTCEAMAQELDEAARELGWGQERLAGMMGELFRDRDETGSVSEWEVSVDTIGDPVAPRRPRRRTWWVAAIAGAGALGMVGVAAAVLKVSQRSPSALVDALPARALAPGPARLAAIQVTSTPAGALLFLDGSATPLGSTPARFVLPRGVGTYVLRLTLAGQGEYTTRLAADRDARLVLTLRPLAPPAPPWRPTPRKRARAEISRSDLKRGDVVAPFSC